jgi:hypothetical protein
MGLPWVCRGFAMGLPWAGDQAFDFGTVGLALAISRTNAEHADDHVGHGI